MKRNGMFLARYIALILTVGILMIQVAIAENTNQLSVDETFAYTRLTLTLIITVLGGILLCVGLSKNNKNQKK